MADETLTEAKVEKVVEGALHRVVGKFLKNPWVGLIIAFLGINGYFSCATLKNLTEASDAITTAGGNIQTATAELAKNAEQLGVLTLEMQGVAVQLGVEIDEARRTMGDFGDLLRGGQAPVDEITQVAQDVMEDPSSHPFDVATAHAYMLFVSQGQGAAVEKLRAIAMAAEDVDNERAARTWFNIGVIRQTDDITAAIRAYTEAINLRPDYVEALANRAIASARNQDFDAATADFDEAIRLRPTDYRAIYNRGFMKSSMMGDYESADADYTTARALAPNDPLIYRERGMARKELGRLEDARVDFEEALKIARGIRDADLVQEIETLLAEIDSQ